MIKVLLKKLGFKKTSRVNKFETIILTKHLVVEKNSIFKNLNINIRKKKYNKTFLTIGNDSVVSGNFTFEN